MVVLEKGQLSYLILSCLSERDMYGLELIEEIKSRAGIEIKMPSLYSNLNRMKELRFISTYLKESTKGPKCSYSSITENGRKELQRLSEVFEEKYSPAPAQEVKPEVEEVKEEVKEPVLEQKSDDYDDFFAEIPEENAEKTEEIKPEIKQPVEEVEKPVKPVQEEIDFSKNEEVKEIETVAKEDDGKFLDNSSADEYNQRLFDVSKDYNKYKNKKSFSENQIGIAVNETAPLVDKSEKIQENINGIKEALLQSRQGIYDEIKLETAQKEEHKETPVEDVKDDGVFITDRVEVESVPKSNRFIPTRLNILSQTEAPLPAPKRDASIDPNCSDIKSRIELLYAKTTEAKEEPEKKETKKDVGFENFDDLKEYYDSQNISFKLFKKSEKRPLHNTNKINFFVDLVVFGLLSVASVVMFLVLNAVGLTNKNTNFLYYLFPILFFVYLGVKFYMYKKVVSKVPRPLYNFVVVWGGTLILSLLVFCLNLAGGMEINNIPACSTTLFVPIMFFVVTIVIKHYIQLFALKRFWK